MKVALYIGSHEKDSWTVRLGWAVTRLVQKGKFSNVTHVEAILKEHENGEVTIGSSSIREGGVRIKRCKLEPEHWIILDVPRWDADESLMWFIEHSGEPYDWRGALASCMPFDWRQKKQWFCNEAVGASIGLTSPDIFGPAQFAAMADSLK